MIYLTAIG